MKTTHLVLALACGCMPAMGGNPVTVTFTLQRVIEIHCDEPTACPNDYYAEVDINGMGPIRQPAAGYVEATDFSPNWTFTREVDSGLGTIPIVVKLWDFDSFLTGEDDQVDINDGARTLTLTLDLTTGDWYWPGGSPRGVPHKR